MPSFRAFSLPLAMASFIILSNSLLRSVDAQSTQVKTSWNVKESLEVLSKTVEGLTAKIELQTTALNTLEAKVELQANSLSTIEALLNRQDCNVDSELKDLVTTEDWQQPAPLHSTSRTIVAREGNDVEIRCVVRGTPETEIKWTRENGTLESQRVVVENNGKSLRIKKVRSSDEGTYVCVAANGVGAPASQSARLQVYNPADGCLRIIEADRGSLEIETSSTSCLWIIKLQNTTGFRLELDPRMTESVLVIPEQKPSSSNVQSIQITGSKNASYEFEGKSLAIVAPPGLKRSTISWTGLAADDSGVASNTKIANDLEGTLEWESRSEGTDKIFWGFDHDVPVKLNWTLNTASTTRDQGNTCEDVSFSILQIRPDGNISEIHKTCDGWSVGSVKLGISSQLLVLLHMEAAESLRSKLRVSWTPHDEPLEQNVDGIIAGSYSGASMVNFKTRQTRYISAHPISGLAFEWNSRKIYYLEKGITRSNLDGSDSKILVSDPSSTLWGLTIQPTSGNLYYGNRTGGTIRVCDRDAVKCSTIVTSGDLSDVYDLAVHRSKGLLFWSIESRKTFRANLDGSNATALLEGSVRGLHVDEQEGRLYWAADNGIGSCDLDGQDIRTVPGVTTYSHGLALDGDNIYYATSSGSIYVISKSGTDSRLVAQMSNPAWNIDVFGTRVSDAPWNPCKQGWQLEFEF